VAHPAREVGVLKQYGAGEGEGELGADFTSLVMLRGVNVLAAHPAPVLG
jgi:hypothetical protein